jgi:hypothetical protein
MKPGRAYFDYLEDMLYAIEKIRVFTHDMDESSSSRILRRRLPSSTLWKSSERLQSEYLSLSGMITRRFPGEQWRNVR